MSGEWFLLMLFGSIVLFAIGRRSKKFVPEDENATVTDLDSIYPDSPIGRTMFIIDVLSWLLVAFVYIVTLSLAQIYVSAPYNLTLFAAFLHAVNLLWYLWGGLFLLSVVCWILTKSFWWGGVRTVWWFIVPSGIFTFILTHQL